MYNTIYIHETGKALHRQKSLDVNLIVVMVDNNENELYKVEEFYPNAKILSNKGNKRCAADVLNAGLQEAVGNTAYIFRKRLFGLGCIRPPEPLILNTEFFLIANEVIEKIGYFDNVFIDQLHLLDYAYRAKLAGFSFKIGEEIVAEELSDFGGINQLSFLQFGSKWGIPDDTPPGEFWNYLKTIERPWEDRFYVK